MGWCDLIQPEEVGDVETFCDYCRQELGTPNPTKAIISKATTRIKKLGEKADWSDLCWAVSQFKQGKEHPDSPADVISWVHGLVSGNDSLPSHRQIEERE